MIGTLWLLSTQRADPLRRYSVRDLAILSLATLKAAPLYKTTTIHIRILLPKACRLNVWGSQGKRHNEFRSPLATIPGVTSAEDHVAPLTDHKVGGLCNSSSSKSESLSLFFLSLQHEGR